MHLDWNNMFLAFCARFQRQTYYVPEEEYVQKVGLVSASDRFRLIPKRFSKWVHNVLSRWSWTKPRTEILLYLRLHSTRAVVFIHLSLGEPSHNALSIAISLTALNYIRRDAFAVVASAERRWRRWAGNMQSRYLHVPSNARGFARWYRSE